eukprot:1446834-Pleurochrysis_carterae.AAC.5
MVRRNAYASNAQIPAYASVRACARTSAHAHTHARLRPALGLHLPLTVSLPPRLRFDSFPRPVSQTGFNFFACAQKEHVR